MLDQRPTNVQPRRRGNGADPALQQRTQAQQVHNEPKAPPEGADNKLLPLHIAGLRLELDGLKLINGIDLTLADGATTIVMGPNGAGKSLFVRLLHGLLTPTSGTIKWGGTLLSPAVRKAQAMVFQRPVLLRRSVAANIDFVLKLRGRFDAAQRDSLLDSVGLLDRARQPARLLSGGEQQRLALARALATNPRVLLLDEPTASLDPHSTAAIETIVATAGAAGTKIIFITHDIGQARRLAGDVVFIANGLVAEHAKAEAFFTCPTSPAAAAYLEGRLLV